MSTIIVMTISSFTTVVNLREKEVKRKNKNRKTKKDWKLCLKYTYVQALNKAVYRPVLTYGSKSLMLLKGQKSKIQVTEMKYLSRVLGVTRSNGIRN